MPTGKIHPPADQNAKFMKSQPKEKKSWSKKPRNGKPLLHLSINLSPNMKTYLETIAKNLNLPQTKKKEILREIENHLKESVEAFELLGMSNETATTKAYNEFGNAKEVGTRLTKVHQHFLRTPFRIALLSLTAIFTLVVVGNVSMGTYIAHRQLSIEDFEQINMMLLMIQVTIISIGQIITAYFIFKKMLSISATRIALQKNILIMSLIPIGYAITSPLLIETVNFLRFGINTFAALSMNHLYINTVKGQITHLTITMILPMVVLYVHYIHQQKKKEHMNSFI